MEGKSHTLTSFDPNRFVVDVLWSDVKGKYFYLKPKPLMQEEN